MNVLIVGYGRMGHNHRRVLEHLDESVDGYGQIQVKTLDPGRNACADETHLTKRLVEWADTVCIATPVDDLATSARGWLERGKDVLLEKPGALTLDELDGLFTAGTGQLRIGYTERFNPAVQRLPQELLRVGTLRHIATRRLGYARESTADVALDLACHDLDVLAYLGFFPTIEHVSRTDHHLTASLSDGDTTISVEASHLHPYKVRELEAVGDDGILKLDYQAQAIDIVTQDTAETIRYPLASSEPLRQEWQAFFNGEGSDGLVALQLAEQMTAEATARTSMGGWVR